MKIYAIKHLLLQNSIRCLAKIDQSISPNKSGDALSGKPKRRDVEES